ncbi:hypothetical protein APED_16715 [Acanthopleuribacter pedis]
MPTLQMDIKNDSLSAPKGASTHILGTLAVPSDRNKKSRCAPSQKAKSEHRPTVPRTGQPPGQTTGHPSIRMPRTPPSPHFSQGILLRGNPCDDEGLPSARRGAALLGRAAFASAATPIGRPRERSDPHAVSRSSSSYAQGVQLLATNPCEKCGLAHRKPRTSPRGAYFLFGSQKRGNRAPRSAFRDFDRPLQRSPTKTAASTATRPPSPGGDNRPQTRTLQCLKCFKYKIK